MSITVTSTPYIISWARNRNAYELLCSAQQSAGATCVYSITFDGGIGTSGQHVVIGIDGAEYVFTFSAQGTLGAYEYRTAASLAAKMAACWHITQLFTAVASGATLTLTGAEVGAHTIEVYSTDEDGERDDRLEYTLGADNTEGVDDSLLPNYNVAAYIEAVVNNNNSLTSYKSEMMVFQPDNDGVVKIPMDLLAGLIGQPDVPGSNSSSWDIMTNALLKYRVSYGEMWGEGAPVVQNMTTGGWLYAICGEVAERFASLNLPDWKASENQMGVTNEIFWIIGEDDDKVVNVSLEQPEYLYGLRYNPSESFGTTLSVNIDVTVVKNDGTSTTSQSTESVANGEMYRIDVSPSAVSADEDTLYYMVVISTAGDRWAREYRVRAESYGEKYMLLQNKYGLLVAWAMPSVSREIVMEGDALKCDGRRYMNITARHEKYKVESAPLTGDEARRLAISLTGEYNYIRNGSTWLRVAIEPASFSVKEAEQDMQVVSFEFRFVEDQVENMTEGIMTTSVNNETADIDDMIVTIDDTSAAQTNEIL